MLMRAPLVEAEQNRSVRIQDLAKVVMAWRRSRAAQRATRYVKLAGTSFTPMIVHVRFIAFPPSA